MPKTVKAEYEEWKQMADNNDPGAEAAFFAGYLRGYDLAQATALAAMAEATQSQKAAVIG